MEAIKPTLGPLGQIVQRQIVQTGPISVAEYMALCLSHPEHGYYITSDPLGGAGDFTTAPEISRMFGELIGLWLAQAWMDRGSPASFVLAELGPGRGTLMADAMAAAARVPGFTDAARLWLVETSPALRARQAEALGAWEPHWADKAEALPQGPTFVVANEFFDALPVHQFVRKDHAWAERMVGTDGDRLGYGLAPPLPLAELDARYPRAADDTVVEYRPAGERIIAGLAKRIGRHGGAALIIDYGDWSGTGDTLQALRRHGFADPLTAPGEADLTTHVSFHDLALAARPLAPTFTTQGAFLERLGITARARSLAARSDAADIASRHRRLTHPDEMGRLFKVLGLARASDAPLPGFADVP